MERFPENISPMQRERGGSGFQNHSNGYLYNYKIDEQKLNAPYSVSM
jgi:hypothetical protein